MMAIPAKEGTNGSIGGHLKLPRAVHWFVPASSSPCLVDNSYESGDSYHQFVFTC